MLKSCESQRRTVKIENINIWKNLMCLRLEERGYRKRGNLEEVVAKIQAAES
jgi:hypothetical protein